LEDPLSHDVHLLDHHKSAIPLSDFSWCHIDKENSRCGGKMFFDWLVEKGCDFDTKFFRNLLVDVVDDNDRWIREDERSAVLSTLHGLLGQDIFIERFLNKPTLKLDENESFLIEIEDRKRKAYISNAKKRLRIVEKEIDNKVFRLAFVQAHDHQSRLGEAIYDDPDLNIDAVFMVGSTAISMRASESSSLDLSKVAKLNNGGGHIKSAGTSLHHVLGADLLDLVQERLKFT